MACTQAVETVITQHYNDQLRQLLALPQSSQVEALIKTVKQYRDEEQVCSCTAILRLNLLIPSFTSRITTSPSKMAPTAHLSTRFSLVSFAQGAAPPSKLLSAYSACASRKRACAASAICRHECNKSSADVPVQPDCILQPQFIDSFSLRLQTILFLSERVRLSSQSLIQRCSCRAATVAPPDCRLQDEHSITVFLAAVCGEIHRSARPRNSIRDETLCTISTQCGGAPTVSIQREK